ncbi:MAG: hypothetical protein WCX31_17165 [Salinivirgaceae bacterium]|jgi:hypothetical protein
MIEKAILFIIASLLISGCCNEEPVEAGRYPLTDVELQLIPYSLGDTIRFIHSNGYEFDFKVTKETLEWKKHSEFCEWNCCGQGYYSYQQKTTVLESLYPKLSLKFQLGGNDWYYYSNNLNIDINNRFALSMPFDSLGNIICDNQTVRCYDTLRINGYLFYYVFEKDFDFYYSLEDSTLFMPESILYNQYGLLQIKMTNDETYSLKN